MKPKSKEGLVLLGMFLIPVILFFVLGVDIKPEIAYPILWTVGILLVVTTIGILVYTVPMFSPGKIYVIRKPSHPVEKALSTFDKKGFRIAFLDMSMNYLIIVRTGAIIANYESKRAAFIPKRLITYEFRRSQMNDQMNNLYFKNKDGVIKRGHFPEEICSLVSISHQYKGMVSYLGFDINTEEKDILFNS